MGLVKKIRRQKKPKKGTLAYLLDKQQREDYKRARKTEKAEDKRKKKLAREAKIRERAKPKAKPKWGTVMTFNVPKKKKQRSKLRKTSRIKLI